MAKPVLLLATPAYLDQVTTPYAQALIGLVRRMDRAGVGLSTLFVSDALITRARNYCAARFLSEERFTHLLFVDADIGFPPDLVEACLAADAPVTGAAYPKRQYDFAKAFALKDKITSVEALQMAGLEPIPGAVAGGARAAAKGPRAPFVRTRHCGTGFMLIRRDAFVQMIAKKTVRLLKPDQPSMRSVGAHFYDFFETLVLPDGTFVAEDYGFCRRWSDTGGDILVHATAKLSHSGPATFSGIAPPAQATASPAPARKPRITVSVGPAAKASGKAEPR